MTPCLVYAPAMPGQPGLPNLTAMRGRRKGGFTRSETVEPKGIAAHASAFLSNLTTRAYSHASIEVHRWALRQFTAWADSLGKSDPASFIRSDLEAYQLFLHHYRSPRDGRPLVTNTQLARLGCVRRFFAWLCRSGTLPANPAADLDLPRKQARSLPKTLTAQEIHALLALPNPADPFGLRDRVILELFYATGIRRTEMTRLDLHDYDASTRTLLVRKGKGGKSRMLPIGERAASWLDLYLAESRPLFHHLPQETGLFLSGYGTRITPNYLGNWIKKLLVRCGIEKPGSCHLFRHSCATDMHRGGADIRYVQEMLGHARLETTQIYTHVHIDALREIHTRCHPHGRLSTQEIPQAQQPAIHPPTEPQPNTTVLPTADKPPQKEPPPYDEPTAGFAPASGPKSPQTGSHQARNPADSAPPTPSKTLDFRGFRSGVTYYAYRFYDPVTGRWPSRDPIGENGGLNLYGFVGNNGIGLIDLHGLEFYAAFIPAWWELNDGKNPEFPDIISGEGFVRNESAIEFYFQRGKKIASDSRKKAEEQIEKIKAMSDEEWYRLTSNGFHVKWINSFKSALVTPQNYTGQEVDENLIDRSGTSRQAVINWLQQEKQSCSEIFVTGSPSSILKRVVQRGSEELASSYEWTSFALTIHHGKSGLNFPTGGVRIESGQKAAASVKAKQSALIACGGNPQGLAELIKFTTLELAIDEKKCSAVFTPAQVTRGFDRE